MHLKDVRGYLLHSEVEHGMVESITAPDGSLVQGDFWPVDQFTAIMRVQNCLEETR